MIDPGTDRQEQVTAAPPSSRVELARLALGTALAHPDVLAGDAGPAGTCITVIEGETNVGVSAIADPDRHGYCVELCLITRIVPLEALSEDLRQRIWQAARLAVGSGRAASIEIRIVGVVENVVTDGRA